MEFFLTDRFQFICIQFSSFFQDKLTLPLMKRIATDFTSIYCFPNDVAKKEMCFTRVLF